MLAVLTVEWLCSVVIDNKAADLVWFLDSKHRQEQAKRCIFSWIAPTTEVIEVIYYFYSLEKENELQLLTLEELMPADGDCKGRDTLDGAGQSDGMAFGRPVQKMTTDTLDVAGRHL